MPLVTCPDCGQQVSDQAAACPQCARPLGQQIASLGRGPVQTIEQTGKKWKLPMAIFGGVALLGLLIFFAGDGNPVGAGIGAIGLIGFLIVRVGAWWQHG
jgi:uncharacterized membrane protein YvbJ